MAAVSTLKSNKMTMKLNAGQTAAGKAIIKNDTMPALAQGVSAADIIALKNAAAPVLNYPVYTVEHTVVEIITDE